MEVRNLMKNNLVKYSLLLSILFIFLALILFSEISFWFLGIGIAIIGFNALYKINNKN